jgi:hypothetical protein
MGGMEIFKMVDMEIFKMVDMEIFKWWVWIFLNGGYGDF